MSKRTIINTTIKGTWIIIINIISHKYVWPPLRLTFNLRYKSRFGTGSAHLLNKWLGPAHTIWSAVLIKLDSYCRVRTLQPGHPSARSDSAIKKVNLIKLWETKCWKVNCRF